MDLFSDGDEVGRELFGGFRGKTGCTAAGYVSWFLEEKVD